MDSIPNGGNAMTFRAKRSSSGPGPNPGLTPIDDIHGSGPTTEFEPSKITGRLKSQDDDDSAATEKRNRTTKKSKK
jgi:hypothetical protein